MKNADNVEYFYYSLLREMKRDIAFWIAFFKAQKKSVSCRKWIENKF